MENAIVKSYIYMAVTDTENYLNYFAFQSFFAIFYSMFLFLFVIQIFLVLRL